MRKLIVWLLLVMMLVSMAPGAIAEESFRMAGYDDKSTSHVWTENLFFERMDERVGKQLGVKLELEQYQDAAQWQKAKAAMLSGEMAELPDVLFKAALTTQETQALYRAGVLIDLNRDGMLEKNAPNLWKALQEHPEWLQAITLPDGAIVALPYIDSLQFTNAMWINDTWLRSRELKTPTTAKELTEILRIFRDEDMNGDGDKHNEVPLTFCSMWELRFLAHAFGINANDYYVTMDETGRVSEVLTTDEFRDFLQWLKLLWDENLIDHNGFNNSRQFEETNKEDSKVIFGVMFASTPSELVHLSKLDQYVLLEPLQYGGKQVYRDLTGDVIRGTFAITSACASPEKMLQWVDYLYTEEGFILAEVGEKGKEFEVFEDGRWNWYDSAETLVNVTLPMATLRAGTSMPGISSMDFQMRIDDDATVRLTRELQRLRELDSEPYPFVWMTQEQQTRASELIYQIGVYAEQQMVWFITGDEALNDETWAAFCQKVRELGVDELVGILQDAADARWTAPVTLPLE